jgi:hypothetical protein
MMLKRACFTLSEVGLTPGPVGAFNRLPLPVPPVILMPHHPDPDKPEKLLVTELTEHTEENKYDVKISWYSLFSVTSVFSVAKMLDRCYRKTLCESSTS